MTFHSISKANFVNKKHNFFTIYCVFILIISFETNRKTCFKHVQPLSSTEWEKSRINLSFYCWKSLVYMTWNIIIPENYFFSVPLIMLYAAVLTSVLFIVEHQSSFVSTNWNGRNYFSTVGNRMSEQALTRLDKHCRSDSNNDSICFTSHDAKNIKAYTQLFTWLVTSLFTKFRTIKCSIEHS